MNILLTSVGRRTYMIEYFKQALHDQGSVFAANSNFSSALQAADDYIITPLIYENNYIDFLLEYAAEKNITAVISLFDIDLLILAKNKKRFAEKGITLIVSDEECINVCNDKWKTYLFFKQYGFNTPKSYINLNTCKKDLESNSLHFPLILKPRWGMGSIGIFTVDNFEELDVFYKKIKKDIFNSYLKYESIQSKDECVIIQEKIQGEEYGIDVINDLQKNYVACCPKMKLAMRAGETDIAQTVNNKELTDIAVKLSRSLQHIGNLDVDCFLMDGKYYLLEMNCRFGGQYPFSHVAGVNLTKQIIRWLDKLPTDLNLLTPIANIKACKDLSINILN